MRRSTPLATIYRLVACSALWILASVLVGCGGAGQATCSDTCTPACGAGAICSSDLHGHTYNASWHPVCLTLCSQPSDCGGGLHCRGFGGTAPFVCASDTLPALCPDPGHALDDQVGDIPICHDAQTVNQLFSSSVNLTRGVELVTCPNGCETVTTKGLPTTGRCRP